MYQQDFIDHVNFRKKPGADILESLTANKCDILHMSFGLVTESRELSLSFGKNGDLDKENFIEELGDVLYYLYGMVSAFKLENTFTHIHTRKLTIYKEDEVVPTLKLLAEDLNNKVGGLIDDLKKHVFYEKDIDVSGLVSTLNTIMDDIVRMTHALETSVEELFKSNYDKLSVRYPDGYTNKKATERLDKVNEPSNWKPLGEYLNEPSYWKPLIDCLNDKDTFGFDYEIKNKPKQLKIVNIMQTDLDDDSCVLNIDGVETRFEEGYNPSEVYNLIFDLTNKRDEIDVVNVIHGSYDYSPFTYVVRCLVHSIQALQRHESTGFRQTWNFDEI